MLTHKPSGGSKSVIILGMHRSGTSCLAGSLEQAGLYLGEVNKKAPHNARGNRENRDIMDLNDLVLSSAGGSWDNPPHPWIHWSADQIAARDALIATYPTDKVWGFKEPRTLFTLDGWLDALPNTQLVGTFRHPMAVAQSLKARNGFSIERGLDLWLAFKMITFYKGMKSIKKAAFSSTYKTVWCAGPSIEHVHEILSIKQVINRMVKEYHFGAKKIVQ